MAGCYSKTTGLTNGGRFIQKMQSTSLTLTACANRCENEEFAYFATTLSSECLCGLEVPAPAYRVDDAKCDLKCTGNPNTICGGLSFYAVVQLLPRGMVELRICLSLTLWHSFSPFSARSALSLFLLLFLSSLSSSPAFALPSLPSLPSLLLSFSPSLLLSFSPSLPSLLLAFSPPLLLSSSPSSSPPLLPPLLLSSSPPLLFSSSPSLLLSSSPPLLLSLSPYLIFTPFSLLFLCLKQLLAVLLFTLFTLHFLQLYPFMPNPHLDFNQPISSNLSSNLTLLTPPSPLPPPLPPLPHTHTHTPNPFLPLFPGDDYDDPIIDIS